MSKSTHAPLLITTGEPAGIGMDIVLDVCLNDKLSLSTPVVITACLHSLRARFDVLSAITPFKHAPNFVVIDCQANSSSACFDVCFDACFDDAAAGTLYVIDVPCAQDVIAGTLNSSNAPMVLRQLEIAHALAMAGRVSAIITAPIAKSVMIEGGICINGGLFTGHTEYFMARAQKDKVVMMLANQTMKVALVTTHLPLRQVADAITACELKKTIEIVVRDMADKFQKPSAKILVCGLNPHAGESGHLGDEEMHIINPVLEDFRAQGLDISLALPADTVFTRRYLQMADVIIAMYHDQGLAPLKSHGFGDTVNITLGLPYVRTSVDHGTALDLAGTGQASSSSLCAALTMAHDMAQ